MVSTWSSGSAFLTADASVFQEGKYGTGFTFVDFLPECGKRGGIFSKPQYESFRTLVDRANAWLNCNPQFELTTCESVEFKTSSVEVDTEKMVYCESGENLTRYIRGLRVWLTESSGKESSSQFGYLNLIPQQLEPSGMFSSPVFETLDDVIRRFNTMMHTNPIPGRIITVESQEMKMSSSKEMDPDESFWQEMGSHNKHYVFVIRIFYELSYGIPEEIGIMDFEPTAISNGGILTMPKYEPFSNVVEKATNWCTMQQGIKVCNVQSLEIKLKRGLGVDTKKMSYMESSNVNTYYVRILRIVYTKQRGHFNEDSSSLLNMNKITCKTISPVQLTRSLFISEFETLNETKNRVSAWVKATGVQVLSAETTAIRMSTGGEAKHEASFTYNVAERREYWIYVIRLYINGSYHEPPLGMLPSVPEIEDRSCCVLL